jgi:hypothetical protein
MSLLMIGLTFAALGVGAFAAGWWRVRRREEHGSMSQQWLAEHRAGSHAT